MIKNIRGLYLQVISLTICISSVVEASPQFLSLPFSDGQVKTQQVPIYTNGIDHWGAGFEFDYILGDTDNSITWKSFDVVAASSGVAMRSKGGGYGNIVIIKHDVVDDEGHSYFTLYAHLEDDTINSKLPLLGRHDQSYSNWASVDAGEFLGRAGQTGKHDCASNNCIHLHFEVFRGGYYLNPVDPYDISRPGQLETRPHYPGFSEFTDCGEDYLWIVCPPTASGTSSGLVSHYPFDGNAKDKSGNGNDGTVNGATLTTDRFGNVNSAYHFDGINDYIKNTEPPILSQLSNSDFSISFWVKPLNNQVGGIVDIGTDIKGTWEVTYANEEIGYYHNWHRSEGIEGQPTLNPVPLNQWSYITFVFSHEARHLDTYLNGQYIFGEDFVNSPVIDGDEWLEIGVNGPGGDEYFNGAIDDIMFYDRALSASEVTILATTQEDTVNIFSVENLSDPDSSGVLRPGDAILLQWSATGETIHPEDVINMSMKRESGATEPGENWYKFSGIEPTNNHYGEEIVTIPSGLSESDDWLFFVSHDVSGIFDQYEQRFSYTEEPQSTSGLVSWWPGDGHALDVQGPRHGINNGVGYSTGMVDQGFDFSGNDNFIEIPNPPTFTELNDYTIEFWMKSDVPTGVNQALVEKWNGTGPYPYVVRLETGELSHPTGHLTCAVYDGANPAVSVLSSVRVDNNVFHHISCVFRHSQKRLDLYIDGELDASTTYNLIGPIANLQPLCLGVRCTRTDLDFDGILDEILMFGRARSDAEILTAYEEGSAELVANYPFNGNAQDESGNGNDGTVNGATLTEDRFGNPDSAYKFDGTHEKIEVADSSSLNFGTNEFSIAVWVNTSQSGIWKRIVTKRSTTNTGNWYSLAIHNGKARFEAYDSGNFDSTTSINDGEWHFITVTRDITSNTFSMYVDGNFENSMIDEGRNLDSGNAPLEIGVWSTETYDSGTFNGVIDDVLIYNRALSAAEVTALSVE